MSFFYSELFQIGCHYTICPSSAPLWPLSVLMPSVGASAIPFDPIVNPTHKYTTSVTNSGMSAMHTKAAIEPVSGFHLTSAESNPKIAKQKYTNLRNTKGLTIRFPAKI